MFGFSLLMMGHLSAGRRHVRRRLNEVEVMSVRLRGILRERRTDTKENSLSDSGFSSKTNTDTEKPSPMLTSCGLTS